MRRSERSTRRLPLSTPSEERKTGRPPNETSATGRPPSREKTQETRPSGDEKDLPPSAEAADARAADTCKKMLKRTFDWVFMLFNSGACPHVFNSANKLHTASL